MVFSIITVLAVIAAVLCCLDSGAFAALEWLWQLPVSFLVSFLGLTVILFLVIWGISLCVDMKKTQEKDSPFFRFLIRICADAILTVVQIRVHTQGLEKMPKGRRMLLVCNHLGYLDPVVLLHMFPHDQLAFISKRENDKMIVVGPLLHKTMGQPINRENDREALKTILTCIRLLKEDEVSIAVFPEGYTSLDGLLQPFRSGVFKIAQKAQVPIVVCTLQNTQYGFRNALRLKTTHVHLHLVDVIEPEDLKGMTAVEIGNMVHKMMADDLGPDLVAKTEA